MAKIKREELIDLDITETNLLDSVEIPAEELKQIGRKVAEDYDNDFRSRTDWAKKRASWLKLFMQYKAAKDFPWENKRKGQGSVYWA
jgi:hypothetical protein